MADEFESVPLCHTATSEHNDWRWAFRVIVEGLEARGLAVSFDRGGPDPLDQLFAHLDRALGLSPTPSDSLAASPQAGAGKVTFDACEQTAPPPAMPDPWPERVTRSCKQHLSDVSGLLGHLLKARPAHKQSVWRAVDDIEALALGAGASFMQPVDQWALARFELDLALDEWDVAQCVWREADARDRAAPSDALDKAATDVMNAVRRALTTQAPSPEALTIFLRQALPWLGYGSPPADMSEALCWLVVIQLAGLKTS